MHIAICRSVAAGVVYVVGAGNDGGDLATQVPAAYDEVLTVTAMADSDGQPGASGGPDLCYGYADDTPAAFSNFATRPADAAHTVAAPGVCVSSAWSLGRYAVLSGTSMATPHVTGLVALCVASGPCAGLTPAQIVTKIVGDAASYNVANPGYGFAGDPQHPVAGRYYGNLVRAALY
jgi:subtilisin family serine protease